MKKILIILLVNAAFVHFVNGQTLLQQIEQAYNKLDTTSYFEDIVHSYREESEALQVEYDNSTLDLWGFDCKSMSSIQRKHVLDSIENEYRKSIYYTYQPSIDEEVAQFSSKIRSRTPYFVLELILIDKQMLQVDTGKLAFNLIYFDKRNNPLFYVSVDSGRYDSDGKYFLTIFKEIGKNVPRVLKKILRKKPKYLLFCNRLGAYLYVLNDQIYIYKIAHMKEYELNEYLRKTSASKSK